MELPKRQLHAIFCSIENQKNDLCGISNPCSGFFTEADTVDGGAQKWGGRETRSVSAAKKYFNYKNSIKRTS